jgi:hypothetical protein
MFWRFIEIYADPDDSRIILLLWLPTCNLYPNLYHGGGIV